MGAVEALFAAFGLLAFLFLVWVIGDSSGAAANPPPLEEDPALPYREAMAAALRIQEAGSAAEADIWATAAEDQSPQSDADPRKEKP